jgi:NAD(P)-dependent dehydrogenase (short-subunit alcohol dehydrogenase family)
MKQVEKKTAIITGSGRGTGKETVVLLAHSHLTDSKTLHAQVSVILFQQ